MVLRITSGVSVDYTPPPISTILLTGVVPVGMDITAKVQGGMDIMVSGMVGIITTARDIIKVVRGIMVVRRVVVKVVILAEPGEVTRPRQPDLIMVEISKRAAMAVLVQPDPQSVVVGIVVEPDLRHVLRPDPLLARRAVRILPENNLFTFG
jgi:hypothetical protein